MARDIFDEMAERWPSALVARTEIGKFTGGLLSAKYMANLSCLGLAPESLTCGRKVAYKISGPNGLVAWLRARSTK